MKTIAKPKPLQSAGSMGNVHSVMKNVHGNVLVRHPSLPGTHMIAPGTDYKEPPPGSMSKNSPPGGIVGGLAPSENDMSAGAGEYANS